MPVALRGAAMLQGQAEGRGQMPDPPGAADDAKSSSSLFNLSTLLPTLLLSLPHSHEVLRGSILFEALRNHPENRFPPEVLRGSVLLEALRHHPKNQLPAEVLRGSVLPEGLEIIPKTYILPRFYEGLYCSRVSKSSQKHASSRGSARV